MGDGRDLMEVDCLVGVEGLVVDGKVERELGVDGLEIDVTDDILVLRLEDLLLEE